MNVPIILFIISLTVASIALYLVKNSHFYRDDESIKLPLGLWILILLATLIPVLNIILCILGVFFLFTLYQEEELEFNEDFWLLKKY